MFRDLVAGMDAAELTTFGESTTYTSPTTGVAVLVTGIFHEDYQAADAGFAGVQGVSEAVFYRLSDLPTNPATDHPVITARGIEFLKKEVQPDGLGGVLITLQERRR